MRAPAPDEFVITTATPVTLPAAPTPNPEPDRDELLHRDHPLTSVRMRGPARGRAAAA